MTCLLFSDSLFTLSTLRVDVKLLIPTGSMSTTKQEIRKYELILILPSDRSTDERAKIIETVKGEITSNKGDIHHFDEWPLRSFCYPIKKYKEGYYYIINFTLSGKALPAFDKYLRLNTDVLRHMIMLEPEQGYHYFTYPEDKAFYLGEGVPVKTARKISADAAEAAAEEAKEAEEAEKEAVEETKETVVAKKTPAKPKETAEESDSKDAKVVEDEKAVEEEKTTTKEEATETSEETKEVEKKEVVKEDTAKEEPQPEKKEPEKTEKEVKAEKEKLDEERLKELDEKLDQLLLDD